MLAENGAERRRRQRKGRKEKNNCGCYKPVTKIILHMHTPARRSQCAWMHLVNGTGSRVVKQDKSSRVSLDTTKKYVQTHQRVRMCKGERPIGAAKGE